jgi:type II secretory pathway pseudopilin PulG
MTSASIGTPAGLPSKRRDSDGGRGGFTLLEALVALALVLAFAGALGPYLFQARHIMADAERRVAAQVLLRTLLEAPFDRRSPASRARVRPQGCAGGS